jgi:cyclopropane fatty-acyl-phospholipid synthase-like methyltransferase
MPIVIDPQKAEITALQAAMQGFEGRRVLEIGCGDGRLIIQYARHTAYVVGIDPDAEKISRAEASLPIELKKRIEYLALGLEEYVQQFGLTPRFDRILLSWSL